MSERSVILRMLADEIEQNERLAGECQWAAQTIAGLVDKLDSLQEQWMDDNTSHNEFVQYLMDDNTATRLEYRNEVKAEFKADLEANHAEHARLEGLLSIARRNNAELERQLHIAETRIHDLEAREVAQPCSDAERRIISAVAELRSLALKETITAGDLYRIANHLHSEPKAPSLPRRETPGLEVLS